MINNKKIRALLLATTMILGMSLLSGCSDSEKNNKEIKSIQSTEEIESVEEVESVEEIKSIEEIETTEKMGKEETVLEELQGRVIVLKENSCAISEIMKEKTSDGKAEIMTGIAAGVEIPEEDLITVEYTDQTVFTLKTTTDGITATVSAGTIKDLKKDDTVIMKGKRNGRTFTAESIEIFKFDNY